MLKNVNVYMRRLFIIIFTNNKVFPCGLDILFNIPYFYIIRKTKREKLTERNDAKLKRNVQFS